MATGINSIIPIENKHIETGQTTSITIPASTRQTYAANFSKAFPSTSYRIFLTMEASQTNSEYGLVSCAACNGLTTGFTIAVFNFSTSSKKDIIIHWVAAEL